MINNYSGMSYHTAICGDGKRTKGDRMPRFLLALLSVVGAIVLSLALGALYQAVGTRRDRRRFAHATWQAATSERRWYAQVSGPHTSGATVADTGAGATAPTGVAVGAPTVVMDTGLGHVSAVWDKVAPEVATFARVVTYDRAGYGWSDPSPAPRESAQIVAELRASLGQAGLRPPYILVGHSFGGLNMLHFALAYPEEVAGLALVDALAPTMASRNGSDFLYFVRWSRLTYRILNVISRLGLLRLSMRLRGVNGGPGYLRLLPKGAQARAMAEAVSGVYAAAANEAASLPASCAQTLAIQRTLDIPLIVLAHNVPDLFTGRMSPREVTMAERIWREMQTQQAALSPQGKLVIADQSGHKLHLEAPDLVIAAIREVAQAQLGAHVAAQPNTSRSVSGATLPPDSTIPTRWP